MCIVSVKDTLLMEAEELNPNISRSQIVEKALTFYLAANKKIQPKPHFLNAIGKLSFDSEAVTKLREDSII